MLYPDVPVMVPVFTILVMVLELDIPSLLPLIVPEFVIDEIFPLSPILIPYP